ncbi:MAG: PGPGW domain-containing protein [Propionibacteriaceae bacterium]
MPGRRENTDELDPAGLEPVDPLGVKAQAARPSAEPRPAEWTSAESDAATPNTVLPSPPVTPAGTHPSSTKSSDQPVSGTAPLPDPEPAAAAVDPADPEVVDYSDDNILIDAHEDRWHWRRKIRANPHQLRIYRVIVAIGGLLFVALGLVTGPLPGPGGIPLILLGIAIWSSEFEWAHRLMHFFKAQLKRFQSWTRWQQVGFWVAFFSFCGLCGYAFMLATGVPGWVPEAAGDVLQRLPGL